MKLCVYTVVTGQSERLNDQPIANSSDVPFICLTDDPSLQSDCWQIRLISPTFGMDSIRSQRIWKLQPNRYLPEFDHSIYVDNSIVLTELPEKILERYAPTSGFAIFWHSFRNAVLDEFLEVLKDGLDDPARIFEQLNHYSAETPAVLEETPFWAGILIRQHENPAVIRMQDIWLAHVLRYSRRDELSVNWAFRAAKLAPDFHALDNHHSWFHVWGNTGGRKIQTRAYLPISSLVSPLLRVRQLEQEMDTQTKALVSHQEKLAALTEKLDASERRAEALEQARLTERAELLARCSQGEARLSRQSAETEAERSALRAHISELSDKLAATRPKMEEQVSRLAADFSAVRAGLEKIVSPPSPYKFWKRHLKNVGGRLLAKKHRLQDFLFRALVKTGLTKRHRKFREQRDTINRSGLFDAAWYTTQYGSLLARTRDPVLHFIRCGAALHCQPNPLFDTKWYLSRNPEVSQSKKNPLLHFIEIGADERLDPGPLFNTRKYISQNAASFRKGENPLAHYLRHQPCISTGSPGGNDSISGHGATSAGNRISVVFLSGEPDTPGAIYRVDMSSKALCPEDFSVQVLRSDEIGGHETAILNAQVLVIWRMAWNDELEKLLNQKKAGRGKILFDVDDYMFDPAAAKLTIIDGIRTLGLDETSTAAFFGTVQRTLQASDCCTAPTKTLTARMREFGKPAHVLANGFDWETYKISRQSIARWRIEKNDDLFRIGYAGGTRTHQKDFLQAAAAIARVLRKYPRCRLVLFCVNTINGTVHCLDIDEFPEFADLKAQIEWREMVPLRQLSREMARFDINVAPLEAGNVFCEAKSELKYFESALVDVPTIASPTIPYKEAISHGHTGFLAETEEGWFDCLDQLISQPRLRERVGRQAFFDVFWKYGPEHRAEKLEGIVRQLLEGKAVAAKFYASEIYQSGCPKRETPEIPEFEVILEWGNSTESEVDVVVPLYNYAHFVEETLDSLRAQSLEKKGLIVVDDCSSDHSLHVARGWIEQNKGAFTHVALLRNAVNSGLSLTRNAGFSFSHALFVMPVDADNLLQPTCLQECYEAIVQSRAAAAYPTVQEFGEKQGQRSCAEWDPSRLAIGNYIDAMAVIRRCAWAAVGGYEEREGWEDYDLWAKFVENGFWGIWVKESVAFYRVHEGSMLRTITETALNNEELLTEMNRSHPWLQLSEMRRQR